MLGLLCVVGFVASAAAILIGFVPPSQFESGNAVAYGALILAGTFLIGLLPPWLFLRFQKPSWKTARLKSLLAPLSRRRSPPLPRNELPTLEPVRQFRRPGRFRPSRRARGTVGSAGPSPVSCSCSSSLASITYSGKKETQEAQQKAQQLTQKLEAAGLRVPQDQDIIVRSLGNDGGAVCENPGNALGRAILYDELTNGADFVGRRPVIADRRRRARRGADPGDLLPRQAG